MTTFSNALFSEQYRIKALQWVDADAAARLLEDTKSAVLAEMMKGCGNVPAAHAERDVKASPQWKEHVEKTVQARSAANRLKVEMEYLRMKHAEQQSMEATKRAEMKL